MRSLTIPIGKPSSPVSRSDESGASSLRSRRTHSLAVLSAANPARFEVPLQFRSVALAGADRIAGVLSLAGLVVRAVGALPHRVFAFKEVGLLVVSICNRRSLHADQSGVEKRACGPLKLSIRYAK